MSVSDIFTLNNSIAPRLIRILYVVALVLITICVVAGVARGIAGMARSQGPRVTVIAPRPPAPVAAPAPVVAPTQVAPAAEAAAPTVTPAAPTAAPAPATPQVAPAPPPGPRAFERRRFRDGMGPRFERRDGRGGQAAMLVGIVRIIGTLVAGLVAIMVVRVLAEVATAILAMGEKAKASPGS